jgi:hypothetical protein
MFRSATPAKAAADNAADTDGYTKDDEKLVVSQPDGFMAQISLTARVDFPPDGIYDILTDPDNARLFRNLKECTKRVVLEDDGNYQKVEVEHSSGWRFLMFHGEFHTSCLVEQDRAKGTMLFHLAKPGIMKKFEGLWRVAPLMREDGTVDAKQSHVTLEQSLLPAFAFPKPFDHLLKGICKSQIQGMMEDLRTEVRRQLQGNPIPKDQVKQMAQWKVKSWRTSSEVAPQSGQNGAPDGERDESSHLAVATGEVAHRDHKEDTTTAEFVDIPGLDAVRNGVSDKDWDVLQRDMQSLNVSLNGS